MRNGKSRFDDTRCGVINGEGCGEVLPAYEGEYICDEMYYGLWRAKYRNLETSVCPRCGRESYFTWVTYIYQPQGTGETKEQGDETMAKVLYYPWYWSAKKPLPKKVRVTRVQKVKDGASTKATRVLGELKVGDILMIDLAETWDSWTRIISKEGCSPVPQEWIDLQSDKPKEEKEGWLDDSAYVAVDPTPEPEPGGSKRKWRITAEIEEITEE